MFDTQTVPGLTIDSPYNPLETLKTNSVTNIPSDLYFLIRAVQLFRGISYAFDMNYSLASKWVNYAKNVVDN
jgi:hypothetical protein